MLYISKLSIKGLNKIDNVVNWNPFLSSIDTNRNLKSDVDTSTVRRYVIKITKSLRFVPLLKNRLQFAKEHIHGPATKWHNILWIDNSKTNLFDSDKSRKFVRRSPGQALSP